jgi:hypothetical protein
LPSRADKSSVRQKKMGFSGWQTIILRRARAVLKPPQSRRFATAEDARAARSVWTAAVDRRFRPRNEHRPVEIKHGL